MKVEQLRLNIYISLLASLAIVIHALESTIPSPLPWIKFGLANTITLAAIVMFGLKAGMTVTLTRVFVGTLLTGTFMTPAFFLALSGGVVSTLVLAFAYGRFSNYFSIIGISIIGAFTHTVVQIMVAYLILIKHFQVFLTMPVFLTFSLIAGLVSGLGADFIVRHLKEAGISRIAGL